MNSHSLLFHQHTTIQLNYYKIQLKFPQTQCQIHQAMHRSLYNKYSYSQNYHYLKDIHFILVQRDTPYIKYKDQVQYDNPEKKQYLVTYYPKKLAKSAIKTFVNVYKYHKVIPRFFFPNIRFDLMIDKYFNKKRKIFFRRALKFIEKAEKQKQKNQQSQNNKFKIDLKKIGQKNLIQQRLTRYKPILDDLKENSKPTTLIIYELIQTNIKSNIGLLTHLESSQQQAFIKEQSNIIGFDKFLNKMNYSQQSSQQTSCRISISDFNAAPKKKQSKQIQIKSNNQSKIQPFAQPTPKGMGPKTPQIGNNTRFKFPNSNGSEPLIEEKVKDMMKVYKSQKSLFNDVTNQQPGLKITRNTKFTIKQKENMPLKKA